MTNASPCFADSLKVLGSGGGYFAENDAERRAYDETYEAVIAKTLHSVAHGTHGGRGIAWVPELESAVLLRRIDAVPKEVSLADGRLRVINLYTLQASILLRSQNRAPAEIINRLTRDVYTPHSSFWPGYLGDEATFREWAETKIAGEQASDPLPPVCGA